MSLTVAAPGTLLTAYDNTGISDDSGDHDEADHDAGGWSHSRQAPAAAGLTPGEPGAVNGLTWAAPSSTATRSSPAPSVGMSRARTGEPVAT